MSEEIVACTGCGKKFRIPDGAAPSGSFDCTACGNAVRYGAAAKSAGKSGGGSRGGKRASRGARRHKKRQAGGRRAAAAAAAPEDEGRGGRRAAAASQKGGNGPILFAIGGGVLVLLILFLAFSNSKNPKQTDVATQDNSSTQLHTGTLSADPNGNKVPETNTVPETTTPDTSTDTSDTPDTTEPDTGGDSGIGDTDDPDTAEPEKPQHKGPSHYVYLPDDQLYIKHESTADTTEAERAEIDGLVATMIDFDAGREAVVAEGKILKMGKKAIPSLLSTFVGQTWEDQKEQFAAFKVQQALRTIVRADLPKNRDFIARFNPSNPVPAKNFKSATKMWICHWLGHLRYQDEFKQFEDSEEE